MNGKKDMELLNLFLWIVWAVSIACRFVDTCYGYCVL